jgi:hypothetical protein
MRSATKKNYADRTNWTTPWSSDSMQKAGSTGNISGFALTLPGGTNSTTHTIEKNQQQDCVAESIIVARLNAHEGAPALPFFLPWSAVKKEAPDAQNYYHLPENIIPLVTYNDSMSMEAVRQLFLSTTTSTTTLVAPASNIKKRETTTTTTTRKHKTAIAVLDPSNYSDPVTTANGVANWIDATGKGDFVWVGVDVGSANESETETDVNVDVDDIVQLCEELAYLDVTGPTMKSRLIVDLTHITGCMLTNDGSSSNYSNSSSGGVEEAEELVEECMRMGVNKMCVEEAHVEWLMEMVKERGKTCVRTTTQHAK